MGFLPTAELVAVAWLGAVDGMPAGKVATTLPSNVADFSDGFVTVIGAGGSPQPHTGLRRPVMQVDCWVGTIGSAAPRWGRANDLAELILAECFDDMRNHEVTLRSQYDPALVRAAYPLTEPRRVNGDPNRHARFTFDMQFVWTTV